MKSLNLRTGVFVTLCITQMVFSQLKIGGDPYQIHPYALLDLESTDKVLLLPRMSEIEKERAFPANIPMGLMLYNTDIHRIEVYTPSEGWMPLSGFPVLNTEVKWDPYLLEIGDAPPIDLSALQPRPFQQLRLNADRLELDHGGSVDLSDYKSVPQQLSLHASILQLDRGGAVDLTPILSTPQRLSFVRDTLYLERGGFVNLAPLATSPQQLALKDNTLHLDRRGQVDLASYIDAPQQLTLTDHVLALEQGGAVDLSKYAVPPQKIYLKDSTLSLDGGSSVNLAPLLTGSTVLPQRLRFEKDAVDRVGLAIDQGNTVSLQVSGLLTLSLLDSETLVLESTSPTSSSDVVFETIAGVTRNAKGDIANDHFLFGSPTMDNQTGSDDNSRFFFHKSKGAFRAGYASGAGWDHNKLGDYSLASNYRTEAYGHRSVALGNATIAQSFSETVLGSYNTLSDIKDKDDWVPETCLFTVGNGSNASHRSDALVILKNGNVGFNTSEFGNQAKGVLTLGAGEPPSSATTSSVQLYVVIDSSDRSALRVMDSAGNETELSPHRFELLPPS